MGCVISGVSNVATDYLNDDVSNFGEALTSFGLDAATAAISNVVGNYVGKKLNSVTKIEKIGKIGKEGYPGIKYSYSKGNGRSIKSIEIHPNHNNHGIHLQGNKWNSKTGKRGNVFMRKTIIKTEIINRLFGR